jgi:hypothetical protein
MHSIASSDSLMVLGKRHWRRFLPMWIFPLGFFLSVFLPGFSKHPALYFFGLDMPLFFACSYWARQPLREGRVSRLQFVFLAQLVPFGIWILVVLGFWGLLFGSKALGNALGVS